MASHRGRSSPATATGAYSKARSRLPEEVLEHLVSASGAALAQAVPEAHLWCGRPVKVFDGSTVLMSDSPANQTVYPQHGNQQMGCGFPIARIVVFFALMTGAVMAAAIGAWKTSETEMSRALYQTLQSDNVAMADQLHGSYVDLGPQ